MTNLYAEATIEKIKFLTTNERDDLLNLLGPDLVVAMITTPSDQLNQEQRNQIKNAIPKELALRLLEIFPNNIIFKEISIS